MRPMFFVVFLLAAALPAVAQPQGNAFPLGMQPAMAECETLPARKAAAADGAFAAESVGTALEFGFCGPADPVAASEYYSLAARLGSRSALVRLGAIHLHRRGGIDDPMRGAREFRALAALDHSLAALGHQRIRDAYPRDDPTWIRFTAEWGLDESDLLDRPGAVFAMLFLEPGDKRSAEAIRAAFAWRQAVAEGPADLKRHWGMRLFNGVGIRQYPLAGIVLLGEAEALAPDDLELGYDIAHAHLFGPPMTPELPFTTLDFLRPESARWQLHHLAEKGYAPAQLDLGLWMSGGLNGFKRDLPGGYYWLLHARDSGLDVTDVLKRVAAQIDPNIREAIASGRERGMSMVPQLDNPSDP